MGRNRGGPKRPSSGKLTRETPTEKEVREAIDAFLTHNMPPIVVAILGQAMIEHELGQLLRPRMVRKDDATWKRLTADRAPLSSFSNKITMGYAFKLFDDKTFRNLEIIRTIRNAFAHSKKLLDFNHPDILNDLELAELPARNDYGYGQLQFARKHKDGRGAYVSICMTLILRLMMKHTRNLKAKTRARERRQRWYPFKPLPRAVLRELEKNPHITLGLGRSILGSIPPPPDDKDD